ncbi:MAG: hypothetical protein HYX72_14485 [Acidobacteria bacterium]|nr:hypothetical protein [Acidobacteriota bacterium]
MTPQVLLGSIGLIVSAVGLVSGLIGAYVGLQNRALLAEVRTELAEMENRIITSLNGKYVRTAECLLRNEHLASRMDSIAEEVRELSRLGFERGEP